MSKTLRSLVSGDKRRFNNGQYNLDLTYITPRLIAMGLPGKGVSTLWRNKVDEVAKFLDGNHPGHYKIFSLGKSTADFFKLQNSSAWFGWSSKKSPPLELLQRILLAINDWLAADPKNVAVIHCKEGRERSGVVIASYLVKSGVYSTPKEALDYYASMRSKQHEGVQTPSQIRYVNYICSVPDLPPARKIFLRKLTMRPVPEYHSFHPVIEILNSSVVPAQTLLTLKDFKSFQKLDFTVPLELSFPVQGDTYIIVYNRVSLLGAKTNLMMFKVGFHTSFVPARWVLTKTELDGEMAGPVTDSKLRKGFSVEFLFTDGPFDPLPVDPASVAQTNPLPPSYYENSVETPELMPSQSFDTNQMQSAMSWYHPAPSDYPVVPEYNNLPAMAPPPVNRETKDNRQALNNATDAVARATERLRSISMCSYMPIPADSSSQSTQSLPHEVMTDKAPLPPPVYNQEPRQMNQM